MGALRIELRGGLVEQEQARPEREHRGEADALQLAAGQLRDRPVEQMPGAYGLQRLERPPCDLGRRRGDVLEPECDLRLDAREDDLVLRILEEGPDRPGKLSRPHLPRVQPRNLHPARELSAVEVRHEPGERAQQRRLA